MPLGVHSPVKGVRWEGGCGKHVEQRKGLEVMGDVGTHGSQRFISLPDAKPGSMPPLTSAWKLRQAGIRRWLIRHGTEQRGKVSRPEPSLEA